MKNCFGVFSKAIFLLKTDREKDSSDFCALIWNGICPSERLISICAWEVLRRFG